MMELETETRTEVGCFVKNVLTGAYDCLFVSRNGSDSLAVGRALESARNKNSYEEKTVYDTSDYQLKQRVVDVVVTYGAWGVFPSVQEVHEVQEV